MSRTVLYLFLALTVPHLLWAQEESSSRDHHTQVAVWAAGSVGTAALFGEVRDRGLYLVGLQYKRSLLDVSVVTFSYRLDLLPFVMITNVPTIRDDGGRERNIGLSRVTIGTGSAPGVGIMPAGLDVTFWPGSRLHLSLAGGVGLLMTTREVPREHGTKANFLVDTGLSVHFAWATKTELVAGYQFYHMSNANLGGLENPGLDVHTLRVGIARR